MRLHFSSNGKIREALGNYRGVVGIVLGSIILAVALLLYRGEKPQDNSFLQISESIVPKSHERPLGAAHGPLGLSDGVEKEREDGAQPTPKRPRRQPQRPLKYRATQVIVRPGAYRLPIGSKISGKLLSPLDTRHLTKMVEVLLPVAAQFNGEVILPPQTLLLGRISYAGSGKRVEVHFHQGLTPEGAAFDFAGQAHIDGSYRSRAGGRMARSMGLAAVSDVADVLTQKEALGSGKGVVISRKSSLANALLYATGEATRKEAERQMERIEAGGDYVTVKAGTPLVIRVTTTFDRSSL